MIKRIVALFRKIEATAPTRTRTWAYAGHHYRGIDNGTHVYEVTYTCGAVSAQREHRFHARTPTPQGDDKMAAHFREQAITNPLR